MTCPQIHGDAHCRLPLGHEGMHRFVELRRRGRLQRRSRKAAVRLREWQKVRTWVLDRAHGRCEARLEGCTGTAVEVHHVRMRSRGGQDVPSNAVAVCWPCHRYLHTHPEEAEGLGLLVASGTERA